MKNELNKKIHNIIFQDVGMEEQIYSSLLVMGLIVSIVGAILTMVENLNGFTILSTYICMAWFLLFQIVRLTYGADPKQHTLFTIGLNCIILPINFICFGGVNGGVHLFYIIGLYIVSILVDKNKFIISLICLIAMLISFQMDIKLAYIHPSITPEQYYTNQKLVMYMAGSAMAILAAYTIKAYTKAKKANDELLEKFIQLSNHDPLTSLYNRRELVRRLEVIYRNNEESTQNRSRLRKEGCYLSMFDIDHFKNVNDTYGHQFGDEVIAELGKILSTEASRTNVELAARYGGEEFMCMMYCRDMDDALERVERIRKNFEDHKWGIDKDLVITVSCGIVRCEDYNTLRGATEMVDKLLYQSKHKGRNQISYELDEYAEE